MRSCKKYVGIILGVSLLAKTISATYGATWKGYDTTVGKINGSGYTGTQTVMTNSGHSVWLDSFSVGGGYTVDVRIQGKDGTSWSNGGWNYKIKSDKLYFLNNYNGKNFTTGRLQFSNDLLTPVNVQVVGEFYIVK